MSRTYSIVETSGTRGTDVVICCINARTMVELGVLRIIESTTVVGRIGPYGAVVS